MEEAVYIDLVGAMRRLAPERAARIGQSIIGNLNGIFVPKTRLFLSAGGRFDLVA